MVPGWLRTSIGKYNLGEMSILLGVLSAVAVFAAATFGYFLHRRLGVPTNAATMAGGAFWLLIVGSCWVAFVAVGRERPEARTSTADLTILQIVFLVLIGFLMFKLPTGDRATWRIAELVTEWIVVFFHVIYFSLAWATRATVPAKTYIIFLGLLVLALVRTGGEPPNNRVNATVRPVTPLACASVAPVRLAFPRFRGHYLKGGYDVPNAKTRFRATSSARVLSRVQDRCGSLGLG
jgi:hypothetical protein